MADIPSIDTLITASDLETREVELPSLNMKVRVRALAASYSNQAQSQALKLVQGPRGEQTSTVDVDVLEQLQVLHGLVEPKPRSLQDVKTLATNTGRAFKLIVQAIDELSGVDKQAIEDANAKFPAGGAGSQNGREAGDDEPSGRGGRPVVPLRTGVEAPHAGGGDVPPNVGA